MAFDTIEKIVRLHFNHITETETTTFTDCVNCLIAFTNNPHSPTVALNSIAFLRSAPHRPRDEMCQRAKRSLCPCRRPPAARRSVQSAAARRTAWRLRTLASCSLAAPLSNPTRTLTVTCSALAMLRRFCAIKLAEGEIGTAPVGAPPRGAPAPLDAVPEGGAAAQGAGTHQVRSSPPTRACATLLAPRRPDCDLCLSFQAALLRLSLAKQLCLVCLDLFNAPPLLSTPCMPP